MELKLTRKTFTDESTIGDLYIDDVWNCYMLEDKDRNLSTDMSTDDITKIKVFGKTAIPRGRYQIIINFSNHFQKNLPLLLNVPCWEGVRIHSGNTAADTEGCLITGSAKSANQVQQSKVAFAHILPQLQLALANNDKIFITIE